MLHDALRARSGRGVLAEAHSVSAFIFVMYWVPNVVFVSFFGFTWQAVVDFLVSGAAALFLTIVAFERIARGRAEVGALAGALGQRG